VSSLVPNPPETSLRLSSKALSPLTVAVLGSVCAVLGLLTVYDPARALIGIWLSDDLKSMGLVVPFISFLLVLRSWQSIGWATEQADVSGTTTSGNWWGFAILAATTALVFLRNQMLLIVTVNKDWLLQLPPLPLVAVLYATGLVLLFGGKRLLKAAWFPVLFMWAVIPVPQTFSRRVDLPLQHASAHVARAFAHALGQQLTQDKLRLMFTPEFGMFIAPGCNGIRGAITLGMAALVVGYLYRFRWQIYVPVVVGAVALGYLFNFLRLCLLVIYYKIALPYPWLQHHAKIADYIIGGTLFLCALGIFFTVADKLRGAPLPVAEPVPTQRGRIFLAHVAAVLVLAAIFGFEDLHERKVELAEAKAAQAAPQLPAKIGNFTLTSTWNDTLLDGIVVYMWGDYVGPSTAGGTAPHISVGISPKMGVHDAEVCHIARGEDPTWHGQIDAASIGGDVSMTAATYNNGVTQRLEASTVCDGGVCRQYSGTSKHVTLIYAHPHRGVPLQTDEARPVPVLMTVETMDVLLPQSEAETQMASVVTQFLNQVDLVSLTKPYSQR
jgi:exosortase J